MFCDAPSLVDCFTLGAVVSALGVLSLLQSRVSAAYDCKLDKITSVHKCSSSKNHNQKGR